MAFEIIASINTAGSIKEIADKLSNEVANGVNAKMPLKIVATINKEKTIAEINNSLNSLSGISIKNIQIDGSSAVKNVISTKFGVLIQGASDLYKGKTLQLSALNSSEDDELVWTSSDENVATVSDSGLVTGVNEGSVTIKWSRCI